MTRLSLLTAALAVLPVAALACSPAPLAVGRTAIPGEECTLNWAVGEYRLIALGKLDRLPGGSALQFALDGNACHGSERLVVHDCAAGKTVVIGPEPYDMMDLQDDTGLQRIADALRDGGGGAQRAVELALAEGYDRPESLAPDGTLSFRDRSLPATCACDTYDPDNPGGTD